jgi:hypothetical protein
MLTRIAKLKKRKRSKFDESFIADMISGSSNNNSVHEKVNWRNMSRTNLNQAIVILMTFYSIGHRVHANGRVCLPWQRAFWLFPPEAHPATGCSVVEKMFSVYRKFNGIPFHWLSVPQIPLPSLVYDLKHIWLPWRVKRKLINVLVRKSAFEHVYGKGAKEV